MMAALTKMRIVKYLQIKNFMSLRFATLIKPGYFFDGKIVNIFDTHEMKQIKSSKQYHVTDLTDCQW